MMRLIDTHVHLNNPDFDPDRAAIMQRASEAGIARMIEIGYDLASSQAALRLAEQHEHIFAVVGVQPNFAADLPADWLAQVAAMATHPRVVAIGEIGLDYHWMKAPLDVQEQVWRAQIDLARELHLPIVIHSREAQADTLRILRDGAHGVRGIMHSFSGNWEYAQACLECGFWLSFGGPLTFRKAEDLRQVAQLAPANRILTETDCPYLTPHPMRGQRNEPAHMCLVVEALATQRGWSLEVCAEQVWKNAAELFGWAE